ncbi:MAG TPA: haloacid dehalogenase type II [Segeticoccus sp.]|nr:haloacid dehalogenase type II [Segeticoccus sp.]
MSRPSVVVFDVNETLSDMRPMAERFIHVGAPAELATVWFGTVLRDGFALTAAGTREDFATLARGALRQLLAGRELNRGTDEAIQHVLDGFAALRVHPDVPEGVRRLHDAGLRLVTLSNGSTRVADGLLSGAGLRDRFERLMSVEDAELWKPSHAAYGYAARTLDVELRDMVLVAVHPWDIDGAGRAGMQTAWLDREHTAYPEYFRGATHVVHELGELADRLG